MCRGTDEASGILLLRRVQHCSKGSTGGSMEKDQTGVVAVSPLEIVGILAIFCTMGEFTILTPSIAAFSHHFADTPTTTIMLANSITGMISVPVSILSGSLLPRVGFRRSAIIGVLIMSLAGASPFLFPDTQDYSVVIASRMAVGVGLGILFPVGNATIIAFFEGERRSRLLGLGVTVQFLFALVYTTVAGFLTEIGWNYSFLTYLVGLVPLAVVVAFMPEARSLALTESSTSSSALCAIRCTPRAVWGYALFALAVWTCVTTVQVITSTVLDERGLAGSAESACHQLLRPRLDCLRLGVPLRSSIVPLPAFRGGCDDGRCGNRAVLACERCALLCGRFVPAGFWRLGVLHRCTKRRRKRRAEKLRAVRKWTHDGNDEPRSVHISIPIRCIDGLHPSHGY